LYLNVSYDTEFDDLMMHLKSKYPKQLFDMDGIGKQTDMSLFSKNFFSTNTTTADVSVDANANVDDMSVIAYTHELPKPFFKLNSYYVLWKYAKKLFDRQLADEIVEKQLIGDIYINDFHGIGAGISYCFNYSTYDVMINGLPMVNKIKSFPPKHLLAFKSQLEQFVTLAANSTLGATGLADMLIIMSYYVKNILNTKSDAHFNFTTEKDCWEYVKQQLISFIYTVNQPMRANQSPFTNISVYDKYFLEDLCPNYLFPDGSTPDIEIIQKLQEIYLELMNEELERTPITFPITTACFTVDEDKNIRDTDFAYLIAKHNCKYGFINIYCGKSSTLSSCCRLRSDADNEYFNSFGSGSSKIGSLGVCTINLPRLAIIARRAKDNWEERKHFFLSLVDAYADISAEVNHIKRFIVKKRIDNDNLPLYKFGFADISRQYSTVGVNGLNEAVYFLGSDILTQEGQKLALEIIEAINKRNDINAKRFKVPHNVEQIPGENSSIKLAAKDRLLKYQDEFDLYSNQFIPLTAKADMLDRVRLQGLFDSHFSGGAICHINVEQEIKDPQKIMDLITTCAKAGVIYFAINYNLQECEDGHIAVGDHELCSICGKKIINNFTRVVGFLTNTKNWHEVRRKVDYPNRQWY
jgi:anaerobic ribonucleoside-triphosphate reductase